MTHTNGQSKTCDTCAYYLKRHSSQKVCTRGVSETEPVHGNRVFYVRDLCAEQRKTDGNCKPEGIHWESKWGFLKPWVGYAIMACIALAALSEITGSDEVREAVRHTYPNMFT